MCMLSCIVHPLLPPQNTRTDKTKQCHSFCFIKNLSNGNARVKKGEVLVGKRFHKTLAIISTTLAPLFGGCLCWFVNRY